jgi:hypothetical protein
MWELLSFKIICSINFELFCQIGKNPMSVYSPQIGWRKIAKDQQVRYILILVVFNMLFLDSFASRRHN